MEDETRRDSPQTPYTEPSGCLPLVVRIAWMALGNIFLAVLAILIVQKGAFSALDIFFWVIVLSMILLRLYDITLLQGLTGECQPATLWHWRRYSLLLILISAAVWILAHAMRFITG